jgi:hypothetical protein
MENEFGIRVAELPAQLWFVFENEATGEREWKDHSEESWQAPPRGSLAAGVFRRS